MSLKAEQKEILIIVRQVLFRAKLYAENVAVFMVQRYGIQMMLIEKEQLPSKEFSQFKDYARRHKVKLSAKDLYPRFIRFRPNVAASPLYSDPDIMDMIEALRAALYLSERIAEGNKALLGLEAKCTSIPLVKKSGGSFCMEKTELPEKGACVYPEPKEVSEYTVMKLKKNPRKGVLQCEVIRLPYFVKDKHGIPFSPVMFFPVDKETGSAEKIILSEGLAVLGEVMPNATITGFIWPQEAIEYAKANRVALAILDIELGTASGLDLCQTLLKINPHTNVVYLTAYPDYALDAWDTGACGFMIKPLTAESVRRQLDKLRYPVMGVSSV